MRAYEGNNKPIVKGTYHQAEPDEVSEPEEFVHPAGIEETTPHLATHWKRRP